MIHIGLPSALRLVLAGADSCGEPKAFAVTARRQISGKYFRTDSQCGTTFAHLGRRRRPCETFRTVSHCARHTAVPRDEVAISLEVADCEAGAILVHLLGSGQPL